MIEKIYPAPLYTFLDYADDVDLNKTVLDCGAGGKFPKFTLFSQYGYEAYGIEVDEERLQLAEDFCKAHDINAQTINGDMRNLPYDSEMFGFVYSYNTIFHMSKEDIKNSINEMIRVLKKGGLLYLNLLSIEDKIYGIGEEVSPGMFRQKKKEFDIEHTFFEIDEGDSYFGDCEIIYKQIRKEYLIEADYISGMIDYIVKK
ncbi:MAG: class I SAM-dependent methyltransferase [Promethearchaeota archaeon]